MIMFGTKSEEVVGGWGDLHNEEIYNLYSSPHNIRTKVPLRMR